MRYKNKYHNKAVTTTDGAVHDSKKEAMRWAELLLLERTGAITELRRQVKYVLIPAQYEAVERYGKKGQPLRGGKKLIERECAYIADFVYHDAKTGELIVEDTKGFRTKDYIIKRKLMLMVYGIKIKEI